ncbi:hypothetical protein Cgig2_023226 [Carnegiea gigantea]|uniref:Uncharacterized protein n=1 Tax=Carnegiea gigantea TaxID=171969 RepID=A0A9Q1JKU8_9CARY|nr:hypothetical protein Cgig2_023226 [Carnegiea gigantea]
MVGMYPGGFGNWALVTDGPGATVHSCTVIIVIWCSRLSRAPLILRRWLSMSPAILLGTNVGLPFPRRLSQKTFRPYLAVSKEAAEYYELPELPQMIFCAMLLNEAERLGDERFDLGRQPSLSSVEAPSNHRSDCMLTGFLKLDSIQRPERGRVLELVDKKRAQRWSRRMRAQPLRGQSLLRMRERSVHLFSLVIMAFPPIYNTRKMDDYVRESFVWCWRRASCSPRPLPEDFHALCPCFLLSKAEGAVADFKLPEMVQVTFYVMLLCTALWLRLRRLFIKVEACGPLDSQEEGSGLNGPSVPSSDEE